MAQIFSEDGNVIPVSLVKAANCKVVCVKNNEKDRYSAVQVGLGEKKKVSKPLMGHFKGLDNFKYVKEFRLPENEAVPVERGDVISVDTFVSGDKVKVTGISKGKGFQGVVRRHGFHGHPVSHGHKDQLRMPGSIGAGGVQHVFKGVKMAGRMGGEQVTVSNLEIVKVDNENDIIYIKGALPGSVNGLIMVSCPGEVVVKKAEAPKKEKADEKKEDIKEEGDK